MKAGTHGQAIYLGVSAVESMMTGAAYFAFPGMSRCRIHYTDGSTEEAQVDPALVAAVELYFLYQEGVGPECNPPSVFDLVSAVQHKRTQPGATP